jgi:hypothetical protein
MTLILGLGNKARNGKDTAAEAIKHYYEQNYYAGFMRKGPTVGIFKFATALYQEVNQAVADGIWKDRKVFSPVSSGCGCAANIEKAIDLPNWVQPEPNAEVSTLAPYGKHPKLLQWWGTEFRRAQDTDYWVKKAFASIPANLDIAIFSDTRFPNEADGVKQRGGYTINVQRLREDGSQFFDSSRPADHPSETALDGYNWDFYLKIPHGHQALTAEFAITLTEYLRGLK